MTQYTHRNGETEPPTEPGWYEYTGYIRGVGYFIPYACYILVGYEGGPTQKQIKRKCRGHWYGPLEPVWTQGHRAPVRIDDNQEQNRRTPT